MSAQTISGTFTVSIVEDGVDGVGITSHTYLYLASHYSTEADIIAHTVESDWLTTDTPTASAPNLWRKETILYSDNSIKVTYLIVNTYSNPAVLTLSPSVITYQAYGDGTAAGRQDFPVTYSLKVGSTTLTVATEDIHVYNRPSGVVGHSVTGSGFTLRIADGSSPTGVMTVTITGTTGDVSYTASAYIEFVPSKQGKLGRNYYFGGDWEDITTETFVVSDTQAPMFRYYTTDSSSNKRIERYVIWNGANGTYTKSQLLPQQNNLPKSNEQPWSIVTSLDFLITKGVFTDFAKLGSAIFNGDYMFSQYGRYISGNTVVENTNQYQNLDPTDVLAEGTTSSVVKHLGDTSIPYVGTTFDESSKVSLGTLPAGKFSAFVAVSVSDTQGVEVKVAKSASGISYAGTPISGPAAESENNLVFQSDGGTFYLYYRKTENKSASGTLHFVRLDTVKFRPNILMDWLNGTGFFRNIILEGVLNNMIQVISNTSDWEKYSNGTDGDDYYQLNPLKIGSYVQIKTTGTQGSPIEAQICLPCAFFYSNDGGTTGHLVKSSWMSLTELRQCVGKKIHFLPRQYNSIELKCALPLLTRNPHIDGDSTVGYYGITAQEMSLDNFYAMSSSDTVSSKGAVVWVRDKIIALTAYNRYSQSDFVIAECKIGRLNNHECIYWEITDMGAALQET